MPFPPKRDHRIPLAAAAALTRRYREHAGPNAEKAGAFPKEDVQQVLDQSGAVGLRIYFGRSEQGQTDLILVGVDSDGNDLTQGVLMDLSFPCPPFCGGDDALNS
jgi:hypothetical protein